MSEQTRIQWCDATWNPCTGCTRISEGCEHCYAERMAKRNLPYLTDGHGFTPAFHPGRLDKPLHWRKPRRIFVCSMSDLFHEAFTDEQRDAVFVTMALAWRHTFMVLTKRPGQMHRYLLDSRERILEKADATGRHIEATWSKARLLTAYARTGAQWEASEDAWPLPNVCLGVTAETQRRADERIPILLDTPAAGRFVSVEPMLSEIDLRPWLAPAVPWPKTKRPKLNWVICGPETGPGKRHFEPKWGALLRNQCAEEGVPYFDKRDSHAGWREFPEADR